MYFNQSDYNDELINNFILKCENVKRIIDKTWKKIILCDFKEGMQDISILFAELEIVINYVDKLNKNKKELMRIEEIFEKLTLLEKAISIPDYILVADLIKYEIKPIIEEWDLKLKNEFKVYLN